MMAVTLDIADLLMQLVLQSVTTVNSKKSRTRHDGCDATEILDVWINQ